MSASPVQWRTTAKLSLVPSHSIPSHSTRVRVGRHSPPRVRMGRHLPSGNTARPDRYEQSFMAIRLHIYDDKRCALSSLYANWLKAWKVRKGCCPFHLLLPVRVWSDGTSPHLPPLTERMNEEHSPIYAWDQSHKRYAISNAQPSILHTLSFLSSSSCLLFPELTQASECLRLTAARASDPSLSPSLSGSWRSAFPVLRSLTSISS